jgi:hypothetical protein
VESGDETTKFRTTRHGDDAQGFEHTATEYRAEGMSSESVAVTAYGLADGLDLNLSFSENVLPGGEKVSNCLVRATAPVENLESLEIHLRLNFEVDSVVDL